MKIGKGSFGTVREAIHRATQEKVAIKIIRKETLQLKISNKESWKKEINILRELRHPNLCQYYHMLETKEEIYIVMEHCKGQSLQRIMK